MDAGLLLLAVWLVVGLFSAIGWAVMRGIQKRRLLRRHRDRHMTQDWRKRCL